MAGDGGNEVGDGVGSQLAPESSGKAREAGGFLPDRVGDSNHFSDGNLMALATDADVDEIAGGSRSPTGGAFKVVPHLPFLFSLSGNQGIIFVDP